jgi:hypothetical protein
VRDALRVARDIREGRAAFHALAQDAFSSGKNLDSRTSAALAHFVRADREVRSSSWIGAWSHVPLLGQPARWLRGTTTDVLHLGRVASDVAAKIESQLSAAGDPAGRLALIDAISAEFGRLRAAVNQVHLPSTGWFLPPVDSADAQLRAELSRIRRAIDDVGVDARGLRSFLAGPTTYLVLASNNAEMRAGGMVLQAGTLHAADGQLAAGSFFSASDLTLKTSVAVPPEIQSLYGWLDPGKDWRNTGSSPDFPVVAPIYVAMGRQRTDLSGARDVAGAAQLDVYALRRLLGVVGPVVVEGRRYSASNVERLVMHDLYAAFGSKRRDIEARHHELGQLAEATFLALAHRHWDPHAFLKALSATARGRHLLLWSSRPDEEDAWQRLGVDGALRRDGLMVTVQNHGGNKLDWFLRPTVTVATRRLKDGYRKVTLRITIDNPTPQNQPANITGGGTFVPVGTYRAFVAVYLPGWATNVEIQGSSTLIAGPDGPMRVVGTRLDVARAHTQYVVVVFDAPPKAQIDLMPSGRIPPVPFDFAGRSLDDAVPHRIAL